MWQTLSLEDRIATVRRLAREGKTRGEIGRELNVEYRHLRSFCEQQQIEVISHSNAVRRRAGGDGDEGYRPVSRYAIWERQRKGARAALRAMRAEA